MHLSIQILKFIVIFKKKLLYIGFVKLTIVGAKKPKWIPKIKYTIFLKTFVVYII
jgi:hypothetical protein